MPLKVTFSALAWRQAGALPLSQFSRLREELERRLGAATQGIGRIRVEALDAVYEVNTARGVIQLLELCPVPSPDVPSGGP